MRRIALATFCFCLAGLPGVTGWADDLLQTVDKHLETGAKLVDSVEARVNDDVITHREFEEQTRKAAAELSRDPDDELRQVVLRQMVEDLLILQLARKENMAIPEDQLKSLVDKEIAARIARFPSQDEFYKYLERTGISLEAYREDLIEDLRKSAMITRMQYRMADTAPPTAEEIEQFKRDNPSAAEKPDKLRVGLIQLPLPQDATPEEAERVMLRAQTIKARLDAGEAFDRMAREYSAHPSRESGGYLGVVTRGDVEELDFLFDKDPGFTSEPVRVGAAVRIYRVLEKQGLADLVRKHKFEVQLKKTLDELKASAIIEIRGQRVEYF